MPVGVLGGSPTLAIARGFGDDSGTVSNLKCERSWIPQNLESGVARAHWMALNASSRYMTRKQLRDRFMYMIHARTGSFGIWFAEKDRFEVLMERGRELVLASEYHWDRSGLGTAKPFIELDGPVPPGMEADALAAKQREITYDQYVAMTRPFSDPARAMAEQAESNRRLKEAMAAYKAREVAIDKARA